MTIEIIQELIFWIIEIKTIMDSLELPEGVEIPMLPGFEEETGLAVMEIPFAEYSLTEGLLLSIFVILSLGFIFKLIRRSF